MMHTTSMLLLTALAALTVGTTNLHASCPDGRAGRMESGIVNSETDRKSEYFEWYAFLGEHQLGASSTITIDFAIIPFSTGMTYVGMDEIDGRTFFGLEFENGMVNGTIPYSPMCWNDVKAVVSIADQSFTLTVNGVSSGPLPFLPFSSPPYAVSSVQALRVHRFNDGTHDGGWIDELSIVETGSGRGSPIFSATFDDGPVSFDGVGSLLAATPPTASRPATCPSKLVSGVPSTTGATNLPPSSPYPVPATTSVTIPYLLLRGGEVKLSVYDVSGRLVYRHDLGARDPGDHLTDWNFRSSSGEQLPAGSYFYTIAAGEERFSGAIRLAR